MLKESENSILFWAFFLGKQIKLEFVSVLARVFMEQRWEWPWRWSLLIIYVLLQKPGDLPELVRVTYQYAINSSDERLC